MLVILNAYLEMKRLESQIEFHLRRNRDSLGSYYKPENDPDLKVLLESYQSCLRTLVAE